MTEHRIRTRFDGDAMTLTCSCGWTVTTTSPDQRRREINAHLAFTVGHVT